MNSNEGKEKLYLIYQITNLIDGKIYVGAHITYNEKDKYMGSSKYLKKDIKELGRQNFKKEIIHKLSDKESMMNKEAEIVNREFCHRQNTYNRIEGGKNNFSALGMLAIKDKDNNSFLVYKDDPRYLSGELISSTYGKINVKDKEGNGLQINKNDLRYLSGEFIPVQKGRKLSEETKKKLSKAASERTGVKNGFFNKNHSEDAKKKIRDGHIGKPSKMKGKKTGKSSWNKNKKHSEESIKKMSENHKGQIPWNKGKKTSEETRKKISEGHKGQIPWNKGLKQSGKES